MSCEKFEKKLVEKISSMSIIQPAPVTEKFLLDALSGFKEKDIKIEEFCFLLKMFVLQPITRFEGKRNIAKNMLIKLLEYVGNHEANYFENYINKVEAELQKQGRSYFEKR